jgi:hypothetical protein
LLALLKVSGCAAPAGSVWRHRRAALGFLQRRGSPRATKSGPARPAPIPLRSFLPPWIFRSVLRGGSWASRPSPPLRCGWLASSPALTPAPPQWRRCERRDERQNRRGPAANATEQSRSASFHSPSKGGSPGKPRCAFPVTYPGRTSQGEGSVQSKNTRPEKTKAAREMQAPQRPGTSTAHANGG